MKESKLPKVKSKSAKRVGRGAGSGHGKTSGRGQKGQNARSKLSITHSHFEGGQRPLIKRLPYRRGKGNSPMSKKPYPINVGELSVFKSGAVVDIESLIKVDLVTKSRAYKTGVKILGVGEIKIPLTIKVQFSKSAKEKIEKAKGKVEVKK